MHFSNTNLHANPRQTGSESWHHWCTTQWAEWHSWENLSFGQREASYWPKIGLRSNLIALKFQNFPGGICLQAPLGYNVLARALPTWSLQIWWLWPWNKLVYFAHVIGSIVRSFAKERPDVEHLTSLPMKRVGSLPSGSVLNHARKSARVMFIVTWCSQTQIIRYNSSTLKSSPDNTQHYDQQHVIVSIV